MKKLSALFLILWALLSTQCDTVDQPFKGNPNDTTTTSVQVRNVFIEDFTGHRCKNCPKASKEIQNLVDAFGDRIIALAIHAGPGNFTNTTADYPTDFTTPEGKSIQNFFGTNFLPVGMVNRENWTPSGNTHWSNYANWPTLSAEAMDSTLRIALYANAKLTGASLNLSVDAVAQTDLLHDLKMVAMIKESGIVSPQLMPDDTRDTAYVHNNVLRDFISNSAWGEPLASSPVLKGDTLSESYSYTWNSDWNVDNSKVVVYVYHPDNYRVLQVIQVDID